MNESSNLPAMQNEPPQSHVGKPRKQKNTSVPLDVELYQEIQATLADLSMQLGYRVTLPMFLRKTVVEAWRDQMERYRKLDPALKRARTQ